MQHLMAPFLLLEYLIYVRIKAVLKSLIMSYGLFVVEQWWEGLLPFSLWRVILLYYAVPWLHICSMYVSEYTHTHSIFSNISGSLIHTIFIKLT